MNRKLTKVVVLASLAVLLVAAWHVASADGRKKRKPGLPKAVAAAVKKSFPKATINDVDREKEGIVLYEVELRQNGEEFDVEFSADGLLVSSEKDITSSDLPDAVAKTLAKYAGDAKITDVDREEIHAVIKIVKLKKPQIVYDAEFIRNGKKVEVRIAENGKFLGKKIDNDDDDDGNDDGDNNDDD